MAKAKSPNVQLIPDELVINEIYVIRSTKIRLDDKVEKQTAKDRKRIGFRLDE